MKSHNLFVFGGCLWTNIHPVKRFAHSQLPAAAQRERICSRVGGRRDSRTSGTDYLSLKQRQYILRGVIGYGQGGSTGIDENLSPC